MMNFRNRRTILWFGLLALLATGEVVAQPFVHPGCLSTSNDLARMSAKVAANAQPWKASWDILVANSHAQLSYNPNPQAVICRGGACAGMGYSENYMTMANDAAAAYQCALRYRIGGDANYANKAIQIMNAWSGTLTNITGDSNWLLAGAGQGYQWACAAELLRDYAPWGSGFTNFQNFLLAEFYPGISDFLVRHNGTCDTHYWANWDLFAMTSLISIGVVCDRRDIYDEAVNYFKAGIGTGAADKVVFFTHPGYMGQWQEAGRDQGHCTLGPALLGPFCEIAWNQGDDLYGYATNLLLAGSEYVAKYNAPPLTGEVPYVGYANCENDVQPGISSGGRGTMRPGWDLIYNHYVNRMGLSAAFTATIAAQVRPEGGGGNYGPNSGGYDQLGFTTLTHTLDPIATNAIPAPGSLKAEVRNNSVTLSWWGNAYASSYNVKRATAPGGPYATIASGIVTNLYYVDVGLTQGVTYHYVVSATVGGTEGPDSAPVSATPNLQLSGIIIGSPGSYQNRGATKEMVFDGALGNYYDAANTSGDWAGLDLGTSNVITQVAYTPRLAIPSRMVGGKFQGANVADFSSGVVTLFTIAGTPPTGMLTYQTVANPGAFRYVRYLGPNNGSCNVAEVQFFGAPSPATAPATPLELTASAGNAQVALTWATSAATTSFKIKRTLISGGLYTTIASNVTTTTYLDLGLTNFTNYYYVVSAVNAAGESANSPEVVATPAPPFLNRAGAGTATASSGATGTEGADKAFDGNTGTKWYTGVVAPPGWLRYDFGFGTNWIVTRYDITSANDVPERDPKTWSLQGSGNGATWVTLDARTNETFASRYLTQSYVITNTTAYRFYRLYVTNNFGGSGYGIQLSELGLFAYGSPPPAAPTGLAATPGGTQISLNWSASAGATSYRVKRSPASGGPYTFNLIGTPTATNFVDSNVASGMTYYYVISAVSATGEGANSAEVSAQTVSLTPVTLTSVVNGNQLQLSWPADHTGWRLETQTNALTSGLGPNWFPISGSAATNQVSIPLDTANGSVFFRLVSP